MRSSGRKHDCRTDYLAAGHLHRPANRSEGAQVIVQILGWLAIIGLLIWVRWNMKPYDDQ